MDESLENMKITKSENLGYNNENSVKNGSDDNLKVFSENSSNSNDNSIAELGNSSIEIKNDQNNESYNSPSSLKGLKTTKSENLGDYNENSVKNGSDENLNVLGENSSNLKVFGENSSNSKVLDENLSNLMVFDENSSNLKVFDENLSPLNENSIEWGKKEDKLCDSLSSVAKGKGLRKWKRIKRRDFVKENSNSVDSTKAIKRGMSNSGNNLNMGLKSEGSLSSTGAVVFKNVKNLKYDSVLDQKGEFSDNSSISSTAASGSILRKNVSDKKGVKGLVKSKKAKGEKENSITSSLESDSRSSNFVFVQGSDNVGYNVKSGNIGGENSDDEGINGEKRVNDEVLDGVGNENGEMGDLDSGEDRKLKELDPLAESIRKLQAAQEALEKELQKLKEMGVESQGTLEEVVPEASSSGLFNLQENAEIYPHYIKVHVNTPEQNVDVLERKLEEANVVLKEKEAKVITYEDEEIEDLFKHKLEADFKFLAISRAVENFKLDMVDQVALSDELKTTLNVVRNAESDINTIKRQADKLETHVEETVKTEQVTELGKRIRQFTLCLILQLVLLFFVFVSFDLQPSPSDAGVVPT